MRGAIVARTGHSRARLIERLSDLEYTKLYGRFRVCARCGEEFDEQLEHCPACRSSL